MKVIIIDGLIGCGKSYLIRKLANKYFNKNVMFVEENVDKYSVFYDIKNDKKYNPLKLQYENQVASATIGTQIHIINCLEDHYRNTFIKAQYMGIDLIFIERSLFSTSGFIEALRTSHINDFIVAILNDLATQSIKRLYREFEISYETIFIQSSISECMGNISMRRRSGEENISENYLKKLEPMLLSSYNSYYNIKKIILCLSSEDAYLACTNIILNNE